MNRTGNHLHKVVNTHVNTWFHGSRLDGQSPAITVKRACDRFLVQCRRFGLSLACSEKQFRHAICEATCVMYIAHKQNTGWYGPFSRPERPLGWTRTDENKWLEYLRFHCFSYGLWQTIWDGVGTTMWESILPHWRNNMESVMIHYVLVIPECIEDMETLEGKGAGADAGRGGEETATFNDDIW